MIVEHGPVAADLDGATHRGVLWQARRGAFLLDVPEAARYLVTDGERITVDAAPSADAADVDRYLRTTPLAALHLQQGRTVLHAAWVVPPDSDGAVVLAGDSSTGKSTLATALWRRGWSVGADDLSPVAVADDGRSVALPTTTELLLWPGTVERFDDLADDAVGARHAVAVAPRVVTEPRPIIAVWWLSHHNREDIDTTTITGLARFHAFSTMAYNSRVADALLDRAAHLRTVAAVGDSGVPVTRLTTPRGRWAVGEAADVIAEHTVRLT